MAMSDLRMLATETAQMLARHWEQGWNDGDVDRIMAPFADNIVFSSPGIAMMTGDPARATIEGSDALRAYIEVALRKSPAALGYTLQHTYVGTDSIVMTYSCELPDGTGKLGADLMRVDEDHKVVEWRCHY
jgi:hypothetical protein